MVTKQLEAPSSPMNPNGSDPADAKNLDGASPTVGSPMAGSITEQDALAALRAENARLIGLLEAHG